MFGIWETLGHSILCICNFATDMFLSRWTKSSPVSSICILAVRKVFRNDFLTQPTRSKMENIISNRMICWTYLLRRWNIESKRSDEMRQNRPRKSSTQFTELQTKDINLSHCEEVTSNVPSFWDSGKSFSCWEKKSIYQNQLASINSHIQANKHYLPIIVLEISFNFWEAGAQKRRAMMKSWKLRIWNTSTQWSELHKQINVFVLYKWRSYI